MTINHIAIIMDGNGRWASANNTQKLFGHQKGAEVAKETIKYAAKIGVKHLTLYAFSSENWNRPQSEIEDIIGLLKFYLQNQIQELHKNNIKFHCIGDLTKLPQNIYQLIIESQELTKNNNHMNLYLAFSYGGRDEIIRAANKAIAAGYHNISTELITKFLDVSNMPDVDLMIRTSGEQRISNFLIWQSAYSELYFTNKLWPDFNNQDLDMAIENFNSRKRNFGYARK